MKIEYLPAGQKDLAEILAYIAKESPTSALRVLNAFDESVARLDQHPLLGKIPKNVVMEKLGWRLLDVQGYYIFYKVQGSVIEIRRIIYGWKSWERQSLSPPKDQEIGKRLQHNEVMKQFRKKLGEACGEPIARQ